MTTRNTSSVAATLVRLGRFSRKRASVRARHLLGRNSVECTVATIAPSNSVPLPTLKVVGEKQRQKKDSQMLVTMNRLMPAGGEEGARRAEKAEGWGGVRVRRNVGEQRGRHD
jgi:hypothetical protein